MAGISGGLQFNFLVRADSAMRPDPTAHDFMLQTSKCRGCMSPQTASSTCGLFTLLLFKFMLTAIFLPATLLWTAWISLLGIVLMVLEGPALGLPELSLSLLKDKQVQVPQPLLCRTLATDLDHLGVASQTFPHSVHVFLVPGSETEYRNLAAL